MIPSITSERLCGGIFVAIPTAIPEAPFIIKAGTLVGSTVGSIMVSSKLSWKSTVSLSISDKRSSDIFCILASVYLMAAGLSPSTDPKLPCPSTKLYLKLHSWAILTIVSYTELSPCGWYLPITSPTILADFLYDDEDLTPISFIPKSTLLCTGFSPSLTSGRALETITDIE